MGPIGQKVLKELRKARSQNVVDIGALREAKELATSIEESKPAAQDLPSHVAIWLEAIQMLGSLSSMLLTSRALQRQAERIGEAEDEYMPGGPPQSPILDSAFMTWWMADLTVGPRHETLCTVLADVAPALGLPRSLRELAMKLGRSSLGVYRAQRLGPTRVRLTDLALGSVVTAQLADDCGLSDGLWLVRPLPPPLPEAGEWAVVATPYLLGDPDAEVAWSAYFERVVRGVPEAKRPAVLQRHFKGSGEPRRFLEYIFEGYGGVTDDGSIVLLGVPDQPETLPQSPDYEPARRDTELSPLASLRERLLSTSAVDPGGEEIQAMASLARQRLQVSLEPLDPQTDGLLLTAYSMYGHLDADGRSALERFEARKEALPDAEARAVAALRAGWCSAFEVRHVQLDQGVEVLDTLRRKKLQIREKAATRQLQLGDVVFGWVLVADDVLTFEGALMLVPRRLVPHFVEGLRDIRDHLARETGKLGWRKRLGLLPPYALALRDGLISAAPPPRVVNHDGHDVVLSTAHYTVEDRAKLLSLLARQYERLDDDEFEHIEGGHVHARFVVTEGALRVECNSRERLEREKAALEWVAEGLLQHRVDDYADPLSRPTAAAASASSSARKAPDEVPEEIREAMSTLMLEHMRNWMDEPVPMLEGKTPRQAVKSKRGRETVQVMLAQQEQIFRDNPQMSHLDLGAIYRELGLDQPSV